MGTRFVGARRGRGCAGRLVWLPAYPVCAAAGRSLADDEWLAHVRSHSTMTASSRDDDSGPKW